LYGWTRNERQQNSRVNDNVACSFNNAACHLQTRHETTAEGNQPMYEIIKQNGEPSYPLEYSRTSLVKPFSSLSEAMSYWKKKNLLGAKGYFLILKAEGVIPTALRLTKEHFV